MDFTTRAVKDLPKRAAFGGKAAAYTPDEIKNALAALKKDAISNGTEYADKKAARNAAGTLRANLKKSDAVAGAATSVLIEALGKTDPKDPKSGPFMFWIVPTSK